VLEKLHVEDFTPHLNTKFLASREGLPSIELELVSAVDSGSTDKQEMFAVSFRGPGNLILPQAIYALAHPAFEGLSLFLVPIGRDAAGVNYEAIFNRERR
jgi:hypothetical protein